MSSLNQIAAQSQLNEIARMAYGSGWFENTSGGKGNIGLITGADGQPRVIKFNTHYKERGKEMTEEQLQSSNALRAQLLSIATTLKPEVVAQLRAKLGLGENEVATDGKTLLTRKIVAAAVKLIDANAMDRVEENFDTKSLKSSGGTKFEEARVHTGYGVSAKTLKASGMSAADFEASLNEMAKKFDLSDRQKQIVGRTTASYLTALAEEGKTGELDDKGIPKEGLPSKDELKKQILDGKFGGTYLGLAHVRMIPAKHPTFNPADNQLIDNTLLEVSQSMSADECADAAYFIAKMGTGMRGMDGQRDNKLSSFSLKRLVDHRTELMTLHQKNGTLTVNDMWKTVVGKNAPESFAQGGTAANFNNSLYDKVLTEIKKDHPEWAKKKNLDDYMELEFHMGNIMIPVVEFGVSTDVAFKLFFGENVDDIQCSHTASAYDVNSVEYKGAGVQQLSQVISGDIDRIRGDSSIKVVNGDDTHHLPIPAMVSNDDKNKDFAIKETPSLMKAMNRLVGGGDEIKEPVSNQLKTMCFLCGQAGNGFLTLAGLNSTGEGGADHYPVDKSFTLRGKDSVLYTASGEINGVRHTVQYQIEKDGTSHLVNYSRVNVETVCEVATSRLDKLTDFVRTKGTAAEKANLVDYEDSIVTAANVRTLNNRVLEVLANRPASVVQNVTTNLMGFFAEINLRQAAKGLPLDSFETLLSRYAGNDEQIRLLDFSLTEKQLGSVPGKMKDWLAKGFLKRMKGANFNSMTHVHMLSMREYTANVTINGEPPPRAPSGKDIVDGDNTISQDELKKGPSGVEEPHRLAFHETLISTFPDPKVRAFVSFIISQAEGVKGCYTSIFDITGENHETGAGMLNFVQFVEFTKGRNVQVLNLSDHEANGVYAITIEPDQGNKKGKIKVVVNNDEGMSITGPGVSKLILDGENMNETRIGFVRQRYETIVTIDPNEIGVDGIPSFTVDTPVLK